MTITFDDVEREVRRVVSERQDFIYLPPPGFGCVYLVGDEPSCLYGHVFVNLFGPEGLRTLRECEGGTCGDLLRAFGIGYTDLQLLWAETVQARQDQKVPWGWCVAQADRDHPLRGAA